MFAPTATNLSGLIGNHELPKISRARMGPIVVPCYS